MTGGGDGGRARAAAVVVDTPIGRFGVDATAAGVRRVRLPGARPARSTPGAGDAAAIAAEAAVQLGQYARGEREQFAVPLDWSELDADQRRVLEALCELAPFGRTVTYGELARATGIDDPREIGALMARNPLPVLVPCHRVVAADGLGGYGGGLELKRRLLELEGALPPRLELGDV